MVCAKYAGLIRSGFSHEPGSTNHELLSQRLDSKYKFVCVSQTFQPFSVQNSSPRINQLNYLVRSSLSITMRLSRVLFITLVAATFVAAQECLPDAERVDCHPDINGSEAECVRRGCTWCDPQVPDQNIPACFVPRNYGYTMVGAPIETGSGYLVNLQRATTASYFGDDSQNLTLTVEFHSNYRLRVHITDGTPRWEVPLEIFPATGGIANPLYEVLFSNSPVFSFRVNRRSTGTTLFDSSLGGLTFSDQYLQISTKLPSRNVYGIGENEQHTFKQSFVGFDEKLHPRWALYARDQPPDEDANMYGVQPYYTVLENDGNTHSVAIVNSNAQEFEMHPAPGIVYRTTGGVLDLYFFLGPTPENVAQQYSEAVGRQPLPPYWALGFQLCKYGYNTLEEMQAAVNRTAQYDIPHDVQYGDIDIMYKELDFTIDPDRFGGLPDYVRELKAKGIKFMTILDPFISIEQPNYRPFTLGEEMDVWVKRQDGTPVVGRVWPNNQQDKVYFPDYFKNSTREWWRILITEFHNELEFDGLWIDMNEPANFEHGDWERGCEDNKWNNPPYIPRIRGDEDNALPSKMSSKTLCPDHVDVAGIHYDTHSLYGWSESEPTALATQEAVGKRSFVLSRSTFLGSGRWVAHWLGDNWSKWDNLGFSIIGMLQYNQFAIPFVGSDICGFIHSTTPTMCQRWMELGAFYPFSRNHNGYENEPQDPGYFGPEIGASSREALRIRYTLLPYLYTLLANHQMNGNTVIRALWHEFPTDQMATDIDRQFMWGSGLLISPVVENGSVSVDAYFPQSRWYDYYTGAQMMSAGVETIDAPMEYIPLHLHGGNILPTQEPAINTELARNNPMGLIVALDEEGNASGSLYYDAGDSIDPIGKGEYFWADFQAHPNNSERQGQINSTIVMNGYPEMSQKVLNTIRLLGAPAPTLITVNGLFHSDFEIKTTGEVVIKNLNLDPTEPFLIFHF